MIEKTEIQTREDRLSSRRLRLQTLVRLRWLAVTGQAVTVFIVAFLLKFPLPLVASCSLIAGTRRGEFLSDDTLSADSPA